VEQNTPAKALTVLQDGRVHAAWKLATNWDGDIYLSEERNKIMQETIYTDAEYFTAKALMGGTGINDNNNVFENSLQATREETKKRFLARHPSARLSKNGDLVCTEVIFFLPFTVERELRNFDRGVEDTVPIDILTSGEWASVVMHNEKKDVPSARPKIVRRGIRA
jgi:hypothetical protein